MSKKPRTGKVAKPVKFTAFGVVLEKRFYQHSDNGCSGCAACGVAAASLGHIPGPVSGKWIIADASHYRVLPKSRAAAKKGAGS